MKLSLLIGFSMLSVLLPDAKPVHAAAPTILNSTLTALPGDVVFLQGDNFGANTSVRYSSNSTSWTSLARLNSGTFKNISGVSVRVPSTAQTNLLTFEVSNGTAWSAPYFINLAHGMHYDTPDISSGASFRIFGRNLLFAKPPVVKFYDTANPTVPIAATVNTAASTAYFLQVTAPSNIVAGHTYSVHVSNGYSGSGAFGTGDTVVDETLNGIASGTDVWSLGVPWGAAFAPFYNRVLDVTKAPYNADPTGAVNAQPAIQSAINDASNGGGVVYLPAGTYLLETVPGNYPQTNNELNIWANVVVDGAGTGQTFLKYGNIPAPSNYQWLAVVLGNGWNQYSNMGIANLTMQNVSTSAGYWNNLEAGTNYNAGPGYSENVFVKNVNITAPGVGGFGIAVNGVDKMAIENCALQFAGAVGCTVMEVDGEGMGHSIFRNNQIIWSTGGAMSPGNVWDTIFENNTFIRDCSYAPQPNTRVIDGCPLYNAVYLNNTFNVNGTPSYANNDGETILAETGGLPPVWNSTGSATGATATTLTDSSQSWTASTFAIPAGSPSFYKPIVGIISGTGTGQWSYITSYTSNTLTVSPPWKVAPKAGSVYATYAPVVTNALIYGNTMSNNPYGIELYLVPTSNCAIVNNALTNNDGIELDAFATANPTLYTPFWGNQITGNSITETNGLRPAHIALSGSLVNEATIPGPQLILNEVRSNTVNGLGSAYNYTGGSREGYDVSLDAGYNNGGSYSDDGTPMSFGTVLQNNVANNCSPIGEVQLNTGDYLTVLADTVLTQNTPTLLYDWTVYPASHASVNTYLNTLTNYEAENGTLSGSAQIYNDPAASGGLQVGNFNTTGASVTFNNVNGGTGGTHTLTITYAWPGSTNVDLYVNNVLLGPVQFPGTGDYFNSGHYGAVSVKITLNAGTGNTIKIKNDGYPNFFIDLDKINVN